MDEKQRKIILGSLIILVGLLILLSNLDVLNFSSQLSTGGAILLVGITFFSFYLNETHKFGLLIAGELASALGLALIAGALEIIPDFYQTELAWIVILWGVSTIFLTVFLHHRRQIWSLLPAGVLFTFGLLVLTETFSNLATGNLWVLFLFGLGLTFWALFYFSPNRAQSGWARRIAFILLAVALLVFHFTNRDALISRTIFPILLILGGGYYIYSGLAPKINSHQSSENTE